MGFRTICLSFILLIAISTSITLWLTNVFFYTYTKTPEPRPMSPIRWILALVLPIIMAKWGLKRGSLNQSGAAAGGQRNWIQVICNGGVAAQVAVIYLMDVGSGERTLDFSNNFSSTCWAMGVLGSLASSCGDTFASEIGSVWNVKSKPWLITSFERVPHGTNGGISVVGTVASIVGGTLVGLAYYLAVLICVSKQQMIEAPHQYLIIAVGAVAGALGSTVDSVLGATLQYSGYDRKRECIVEHPGPGVETISGVSFLDNHSVNLITSVLMVVITPYVAHWMYSFCV